MSGYYPYLLCGLPELNFNMNPDSFSYQDLYNQIFELLSPADQRLAELFLAFPRNEEVAKAYLPMQAEEEEREEFLTDCPWPAYQKELYRHNLAYWLEGDEEASLSKRPEEETILILKRKLDEAFYNCMNRYRNKFVRLWYDFDLTLKNTLVAFAARKQKRPADKEFVLPKALAPKPEEGFSEEAEPELITWIKENMGQGDFGLKLRLSYAEELFAALDSEDVYVRERKVDQFRWNMLDEMILDKDFQMDVVLAYLVKMQILKRWQDMDAAAGRQYLQETVASLRKVKLGEEVATKKREF